MPSPGELLTLEAIVARYLEVRRPHLADSSFLYERHGLSRLVAAMAAQGVTELAAIQSEHLARYRLELEAKTNRRGAPLSASFLHTVVAVARRFLAWAHRSQLLLWGFHDFALPKVPEKLRYVPTFQETHKLLALPDLDSPVGLRDRVLLELLYVLGLRLGETVALELDSADLAGRTLVVVGKAGHHRLVPLSPGPLKALTAYLEDGRPSFVAGGENRALFLGLRGRRIRKDLVMQMVRGYGEKLGLRLSAHLLRHACATHLVEGGAELPYIARLLGHVRLETTRRYARIRPVELAREHRRCHPRAIGGLDD